MTTYTLHDLIPDLPKEVTHNKHSAAFRTQEDYALLYPNLTPPELFDLTTQMQDTYPGTYQRIKVVDYFTLLNQSKHTPL